MAPKSRVTGLLLFSLARWLRSGDADDEAATRHGVKPDTILWCWLLVPVGTLYGLTVLVTPLLFDRFTAVAGVAALVLLARETVPVVDTDRQTMLAEA